MNYKEIAQKSKASQDWFELWQLLEIVSRISPQRILEIGVHRGGLTESLREAFGPAQIVGIDLDFSELEFRNFAAIAGNSHDPETRDAALLEFYDPQIDFLFIDGDHTYQGAKADWELYAWALRPGGIVAFHDVQRQPGQIEGVEVRKLFNELKSRHASIEIWNGAAGSDGPGTGVLFL